MARVPRNRGGSHNQLVRRGAIDNLGPSGLKPLLRRCQALVHTKAVLLIDNAQTQIVKCHGLLKQGVGTNHHLGRCPRRSPAICTSRALPLTLPVRKATRMPSGRSHCSKLMRCWSAKNFRGSHQSEPAGRWQWPAPRPGRPPRFCQSPHHPAPACSIGIAVLISLLISAATRCCAAVKSKGSCSRKAAAAV